MKLSKREKKYIYDRVKWSGYALGSTKDFAVKLYFLRRDDYLDDEEGNVYEYFYDMCILFSMLAKRDITYRHYYDENEYLVVEFSSKEIYKFIKYDINRGKKKKKLTPLERRLERESNDRLKEFFKIESSEKLEDVQPFIPGRAIYLPEENPIKDLDINYTPHDEEGMYKRVKANPIAERVYDYINEELKKINEEIGIKNGFEVNINTSENVDKLPINSNGEESNEIKELRKEIMDIYEGDDKVRVLKENESVENVIHLDEDGNPESAEVKVKGDVKND